MAQIAGSYLNSNTLDFIEDPFAGSISEIRFFYPSPSRVKILNEVVKTYNSYSGRLLFFGENGIGKTTLAVKLYSLLKDEYRTPIYISETSTIDGVVRKLLVSLKLPITDGNLENSDAIQNRICSLYENDYRLALLVDISGGVSGEVDSLISELANLKCAMIPIFHMFFFTSVDPDSKNWSFLQDIRIKEAIPRLNYDETVGLINFRCMVAGRFTPLFSEDAYKTIFEITEGNPGKIIRLCYPAMNFTASAGKKIGSTEEVLEALKSVKETSIMDRWLPAF